MLVHQGYEEIKITNFDFRLKRGNDVFTTYLNNSLCNGTRESVKKKICLHREINTIINVKSLNILHVSSW